MLSKFPLFKKIDLSDRLEIERITDRFQPYSDFNFVSLWSWDTEQEMQVSMLNDNLVVRFTDYITSVPFLSFLGINNLQDTADKLVEFAKSSGIEPRLKLIPEISVPNSGFSIQEDRDNFDYVYGLEALVGLRGRSYETKRNQINRFCKKFSNIETRLLSVEDEPTRRAIVGLFNGWANNKISSGKDIDPGHELEALSRFFSIGAGPQIFTIGIFVEGELVGFCSSQFLSSGYAISHFSKANTDFVGVYDFLMLENAKHLKKNGAFFLNYEQDLGLEALRHAKASYRAIGFLKKYVLE